MLLDYSKAFDTMHHTTLCCELKYFGLESRVVNFFQDYLSDRRQKVVNGSSSTLTNITVGLKQGSLLGPLLFSIYTANLPGAVKNAYSHQSAHDFQLYFHFPLSDLDNSVQKVNK